MPTAAETFHARLESWIRAQLGSRRVGYLLGAGSSYLSGNGYPLTNQLWPLISANIPDRERAEIQAKISEGADIEKALDLLDAGGVTDVPHRHLVTAAVATHFSTISPPLEHHRRFVERLARSAERVTQIFSLNYDPLIESSADASKVRIFDGFVGFDEPHFFGQGFQQVQATIRRGPRGSQAEIESGMIHLHKLHGSVGWYECAQRGLRRGGFCREIPEGTRRLMIPPQRRKANDTMTPPYSTSWSEVRCALRHGPNLLNRLVSVGYGFRDEHVNAAIEAGLARQDFTLIILAKQLTPEVYSRWSAHEAVTIVTEESCSFKTEAGAGHPDLWSFERLARGI